MRKFLVVTSIVLAVVLALAVLIWAVLTSGDPSGAVFELLRIFTSWPVIALLVVLILVWCFPLQVAGLLRRTRKLGPLELQEPESTPKLIPPELSEAGPQTLFTMLRNDGVEWALQNR